MLRGMMPKGSAHVDTMRTTRSSWMSKRGVARPRVVMMLALDGMRRDYFDRYAASMPTLTALRQQSAWFTQARVNVLPSNTAVGHSTISTGADLA
jgi:predicted AlkP superfamily pyrophosphatase or phosphodiesterase